MDAIGIGIGSTSIDAARSAAAESARRRFTAPLREAPDEETLLGPLGIACENAGVPLPRGAR